MKNALLTACACGLALAAGAAAQDHQALYSDTDPRVDAEVRTSDGHVVGTVERLRFETPAQAVIDAYVVEGGGTLEIGGREVIVEEDRTSWSGMPLSPVLELDMTREEFEALPDFDEDLATDYPLADDELFAGEEEAGTPARLEAEPDTAEAPRRAVPEHLVDERYGDAPLDDDAAGERIEWDSTFNPDMFAREDWMNREVFTSSGDELGIVVETHPAEGTVRTLVVRTHPDFAGLGETVELDTALVTGVAERERAIRVNYVLVEEGGDPSPDQ